MNIENPQQRSDRGGGGVHEVTLVPSIPKGIDFDSKRIHMYLLRDRENVNGNHIRYSWWRSSNFDHLLIILLSDVDTIC